MFFCPVKMVPKYGPANVLRKVLDPLKSVTVINKKDSHKKRAE